MIYRTETLHLNSTDLDTEPGEFETATEVRAACAEHEGGLVFWSQLEDKVRKAQGWYRSAGRRRTKGEEHA